MGHSPAAERSRRAHDIDIGSNAVSSAVIAVVIFDYPSIESVGPGDMERVADNGTAHS